MDSKSFWILLLSVLISIIILVCTGIVLWIKISYKYRNGIVARIHMADTTVQHYRYFDIPSDNRFMILEIDKDGNEKPFPYLIRPECIERGSWGKYIDYDYHIMEPLDPKKRNPLNILEPFKEMFKLIGALLDTNLDVKLLRNDKFESKVIALLIAILLISLIGAGTATTGMIKSFTGNHPTGCVLKLDNDTWQTIYIASHNPPTTQTVTARR